MYGRGGHIPLRVYDTASLIIIECPENPAEADALAHSIIRSGLQIRVDSASSNLLRPDATMMEHLSLCRSDHVDEEYPVLQPRPVSRVSCDQ